MIFSGQSGVGGFLKEDIPAFLTQNKAMVFTFGGNGFFGYSSSAPADDKSLMWWSTFELDSASATKSIDTDAIKEALKKRHQHWKDPVIQNIIQKAEVQSIYPTYVLDIDQTPNWGELGMVLVGDAAHAMDPTTGQGASQALEDSQTLSLLLAECLKRGEQGELEGAEAVSLALKLYYEIRNPRVREIVERGKKIAGNKANVGTIAEYFMYFFLWLMNRYPAIGKHEPHGHWMIWTLANMVPGKSILGDVNQKLYGWSAEEEIAKALKKTDPNWLYEQTRGRE